MKSVPLPYDLQTALVGVRGAAELAFGAPDESDPPAAARQRARNEDRVRKWKARGYLKARGTDERGRSQFLAIDVLRARSAAASADPSTPLEERARWRPELRQRLSRAGGACV